MLQTPEFLNSMLCRSEGFDGVDGILGIGPVDLTQGTVRGVSQVPTITDTLYAQHKISENLVGVSYNPTTSSSNTNGELTFGGTDSARYTGAITYASTSTSPANEYWGINQSVRYGSLLTLLPTTAGIVDTGTTLVGGPPDAIAALYAQIPGSAALTGQNAGYYTYREAHQPFEACIY